MEKGFTVRELTVRGWKKREDLNFRDDGTKFKAFEHENGMIATYTKVAGDYYLSLRLDYLNDLTYQEYSKLESYRLADEFNGVSEIDADKVTENAIILKAEYDKMVKEANSHKVDTQKIIKRAEYELEMVYKVLYDSNLGIDDLENLSSYEITKLREYRNSLKAMAENQLNRLAREQYNHKELRNLEYMLEKFGYLNINEKDSFYIREIKAIINKIK